MFTKTRREALVRNGFTCFPKNSRSNEERERPEEREVGCFVVEQEGRRGGNRRQ